MKTWAPVILLLAIITGCVPSLNPLYTDKDLIFDPALVGSWGEEQERWVFSKEGSKKYKLVHVDENGLSAEFDARLVRLGDYKFLDLFVTNVDEKGTKLNGWAAFSFIPGHLILQVHEIGAKLKLSAMNPDWLKETLEKNPKAIEHRKINDDRYIILASTADLQKFVRDHADEEGLFGGPNELDRRKD